MELPFTTLDVFTDTRFSGNPLAVVSIPADGPKPTQEQKQTIAREFNLSETVFLHEAADPSSTTRNIDIFLPTAEIPFAGHPTIGTAVSLLDKGVSTLVTKAGPIAVEAIAGRAHAAKASIPHNVHLHSKSAGDAPSSVTGQLSHAESLRARELGAPVFSVVKGVSFLLIELPSLEELAKVGVTPGEFEPALLLDEGWQTGFIGRCFFVRVGGDGDKVQLRTRMITSTFEDPATGAASAALCSYLSGEVFGASKKYSITQGVEMGKESHIDVEVEVDDAKKVSKVVLAGSAVQVMRGHIAVQG